MLFASHGGVSCFLSVLHVPFYHSALEMRCWSAYYYNTQAAMQRVETVFVSMEMFSQQQHNEGVYPKLFVAHLCIFIKLWKCNLLQKECHLHLWRGYRGHIFYQNVRSIKLTTEWHLWFYYINSNYNLHMLLHLLFHFHPLLSFFFFNQTCERDVSSNTFFF